MLTHYLTFVKSCFYILGGCFYILGGILYKSNRYSVPIGTYAPGKEMQIRVSQDKLVLMDIKGEEIIAEHQLSSGKGELIQNRNHLRNHAVSINKLYERALQTLDYVPNLSSSPIIAIYW